MVSETIMSPATFCHRRFSRSPGLSPLWLPEDQLEAPVSTSGTNEPFERTVVSRYSVSPSRWVRDWRPNKQPRISAAVLQTRRNLRFMWSRPTQRQRPTVSLGLEAGAVPIRLHGGSCHPITGADLVKPPIGMGPPADNLLTTGRSSGLSLALVSWASAAPLPIGRG
jgi:hypothetical protein